MQDAFGVDREQVAKGLPSALKAAVKAGNIGRQAGYANSRMTAAVAGRGVGRDMARGKGGEPVASLKGYGQSARQMARSKVPYEGKMGSGSQYTLRRREAVSRNKAAILRRPLGGGAPGSSAAPVPRSYLR